MGRVPAGDREAARTATARVLVRGGSDGKTGEVLPAVVIAERVGWCTAVVRGMAAGLLAAHWNAADVRALGSGRDAAGLASVRRDTPQRPSGHGCHAQPAAGTRT
jgi:hypothetical protein